MEARNKILSLSDLAELLSSLRQEGKKIVHCHGVFDLLHIGHIRYFEQARRFGDVLVVTVSPDRFVDKGPGRPAFHQDLRCETIAALGCVDYVALNQWPTAVETLELLRPDFYVKGSEYTDLADPTGKIGPEAEVAKRLGIEVVFTSDIIFSSTNLINRFLSDRPKELAEYLKILQKLHPLPDILAHVDSLKDIRVLVIGDTILDEYHYCEAIGKSNKDPMLALRYLSHDLFAGGVLAVANHLAAFQGRVTLFTVLGGRDSYEEFIRGKLSPQVSPRFFYRPQAPTLINRRYMDGYTYNKLMEVYTMDDREPPAALDEEIASVVAAEAGNYDLVVAADFGHGAIGPRTVESLCRHARFLTVNTQANAANRNFHTIWRYPRADYVSLAEHELRLATRNRYDPVKGLLLDVASKLGTPGMMVTRGRKGSLLYSGEGLLHESPSLTQSVVDRVGAGDAFFSVTSLAAVRGMAPELLSFLGNVAGALAVEIIGNQKSLELSKIKAYITALLK